MQYVFEYPNSMNLPYECFLFEADKNVFPIVPHWHYFMEVIYILEGSAEVKINDLTYYMQPGDFILFFPKVIHSIYSTQKGPLNYIVLKFDVNKLSITTAYSPKINSIIQCASTSPTAVPLIRNGELPNLDLNKLFHTCMNEMSVRGYGYDIYIQTQIYELMVSVLRKWKKEGFIIDERLPLHQNTYTINTITEYIDEHSNEDLNITEIAGMCHMSYSFFAKKFQQIYSNSCKEYIIQTRLRKAEELLVFTDHDLNYISQETGFADCSHMIKAFKEKMGTTPKQYRLMKQQEEKRNQ